MRRRCGAAFPDARSAVSRRCVVRAMSLQVAWIGSPLKAELVVLVCVFLALWTLYDVTSTKSDNTEDGTDMAAGADAALLLLSLLACPAPPPARLSHATLARPHPLLAAPKWTSSRPAERVRRRPAPAPAPPRTHRRRPLHHPHAHTHARALTHVTPAWQAARSSTRSRKCTSPTRAGARPNL